MQIIRYWKEKESHPIEKAIFIGIGFFILFFIALMIFMENGKSHVFDLSFVGILTLLLIVLAKTLNNNKLQGYLIAITAVIVAIIGFFRLNSFFTHTEIVFTLVVIGITARWGTSEGIFTAFLATTSYAILILFTENKNITFEIFTIGGFLLASAYIIGTLSLQREAALKSQNKMHEELNITYNETLHTLVSALDTRDSETGGHSERVTQIALLIARHLRLHEREIREIQWGALLHDVGKIGIPDYILRKPGKLSADEWNVMRTHPQVGFEMLKKIPFLAPSLDIVLHHHEKFDGTGYPSGLSGKNIPLAARIFAIADTFDAMTNDRPYRKAFTPEKALEEIKQCADKQFDPEIVNAFLKVYKQRIDHTPDDSSKKNPI